MRIKITKIKELEESLYQNNMIVGIEIEGEFSQPNVGYSFLMQYEKGKDLFFITSIVTEIIDNQTFKTKNSIYKHERLNEK